MVRWLSKNRTSPIGVDLGTRSVKMVQFDAAGQKVIEAVRWDLPNDLSSDPQEYHRQLVDAVRRAREGRAFRGRDAVLCLGAPDLFVQNLRVPKGSREEVQRMVLQDSAGRIPFPVDQAEIRFLEAADVRQGEATRREVIVLAAHLPNVERRVQLLVEAGLQPIAVDAEPTALLRGYVKQFRRDEDRLTRMLYVHLGSAQSVAVIAEGANILFIKYIDVGGKHMDEAVSHTLSMAPAEASALRRHNGDRRADQQDPEIARTISEAVRPVIDNLANELSLCVRYHSVTFRGQPLTRMVLGGGEATTVLGEAIGARLDLKCELGDPLRSYDVKLPGGRSGQWDIAAGLALKKAAL
jgi:type IV pilus assembly protein PilM